MTKSTKIIIAVISATLVVCLSVIIGVSVSHNKKKDPGTVTVNPSASVSGSDVSAASLPTESTTAAPTLSEMLVGKWMDSAQMSGYEFFSDGTVTVTYVNLTVPVIDLPINGTANGTYTVSGNTVTVKFSIYAKTISKTFEATVVPGNELTLKNTKDGDVSTYAFVKKEEGTTASTTTPPAQTISGGEIVGAWENGDASIKYGFNSDSTVDISFNQGKMSSVSSGVLNGTYKGIYMTNDNKLTVQFMMNEKKVTQELTYSISGNTMSLTENSGETTLLVRGGAGYNTSSTASDLIGKWTDGANMSGFDFKQGGSVDVTYVNFTVPVINMPINGTYSGTYSVSGGKVTVNFSIYGKTVIDSYEFSVAGDTLTLKNAENGDITTYRRAS
ncbi:MAG: hypothetical protein Q4D20_04125 [Clostridia bacterium]|nr:hypothetical protein [Clostridia bacterium]